MRGGAAYRLVLLVVEEPAGVGDATHLDPWSESAEERGHPVQVDEHARTPCTETGEHFMEAFGSEVFGSKIIDQERHLKEKLRMTCG